MVSISNQASANPYTARTLCRIVGLTCLAGFTIDTLVLALPPDPLALEWRVNFLQQMGDRSIVLLFGIALSIYGAIETRRLLRQLSLISLIAGVFFILCCVLSIRDVSILQQQAITNISNQAAQIQTRIQQAQSSGSVPQNVTPEQLTQASQQIATQAETLKQNAKTGVIRTGIASVGNLLIAGLGLISLGRYGIRLKKSKA